MNERNNATTDYGRMPYMFSLLALGQGVATLAEYITSGDSPRTRLFGEFALIPAGAALYTAVVNRCRRGQHQIQADETGGVPAGAEMDRYLQDIENQDDVIEIAQQPPSLAVGEPAEALGMSDGEEEVERYSQNIESLEMDQSSSRRVLGVHTAALMPNPVAEVVSYSF